MAEEKNEKNIEKNSMYIEVENEEEILRLQQEVIKSNLSIEDVAKIVGKLQKLLELTKYNSNIGFKSSNKDWEKELSYQGFSVEFSELEKKNISTYLSNLKELEQSKSRILFNECLEISWLANFSIFFFFFYTLNIFHI